MLIDEGITPSKSRVLRELNEVTNHDAAVRQIQLGAPITAASICELHAMVMTNIDDEWGGRFRNARVMVTGAPKQPMHPELIESELALLIEWIASKEGDVVKRGVMAHYRFVKIHPFFDGNGRMGRLLMNWIFLSEGYPLTVISGDERARYIESIDQADLGDSTELFRLIGECVERSLDQYLEG